MLLRAIQAVQRVQLAQERLKQARAVLARVKPMRARLLRIQAPERVEPPLAEAVQLAESAARRKRLLPT